MEKYVTFTDGGVSDASGLFFSSAGGLFACLGDFFMCLRAARIEGESSHTNISVL